MGRKQTIIIYPHLNNCGGDLSKQWYVEYQYRVPGEEKPRKERIYKGLSKGTVEERVKVANQIIEEKREWLKNGKHLLGDERRVYEDELLYRNEARLYGNVRESVITTRANLSEFLQYIKPQVNKKTHGNYISKMRTFNAWLEINKLHNLNIKYINRLHIIDFSIHLANDQKLSRASIDKYIQIIRAFFDFELDRGNIEINPVMKIPKMGCIVDCAAVPFSLDDRTRLKNAIKPKDPQLWLACQIQYYCAIRPGTELRLMKIGWIDFDNKQFRVPNEEAKNNDTEIVEIPDFLFDELKEYKLDMYNVNLYVFGKNGMPGDIPLGKNTLRNRFNRYREEIGISPDKKFYSWKHTGAIELINNGAKPYDLMDHLRHKNFDTTEKYLKKRIKTKDKKISMFSSKI